MKVAVIGAGYVGLVTASCLAELGHEVVCMDNDPRRVELLRAGVVPIYEPGLQEVVEEDSSRAAPIADILPMTNRENRFQKNHPCCRQQLGMSEHHRKSLDFSVLTKIENQLFCACTPCA